MNIQTEMIRRFNDARLRQVDLEFGLQSLVPVELHAINRPQNIEHVKKGIAKLHELGLSFSVDLIYGLPLQTLESWRYSVSKLQEWGVENIATYPLVLFDGSALEQPSQRQKYGFEVMSCCTQHIGMPCECLKLPCVVSSNSFSFQDWQTMNNEALAIFHKLP